MNSPYATLTRYKHCARCYKLQGVQLYKDNARALLLCILSIVNSDLLQRAHSVWISNNNCTKIYKKNIGNYKIIMSNVTKKV